MTNQFTSIEISEACREYEPDELEQAFIKDFEATRYARWTALTTEEQEAVCEASEHEAALRYDARGGRW